VRHVLRSVEGGRLSVSQGCGELGVSRSRFYALRAGYRAACRQARSKRWHPQASGGNHRQAWSTQVCDTLRRLLGATPPSSYSFAASEVHRRHGLKLHRASVRRFALQQGLAPDTGWKQKPAAVRRWQRAQIGSLWQLDATPHRWFPSQQKPSPLLHMLDDCSRLILGATLCEAETLLAYLDFLPTAFLAHGLPLQIYVDHHSFFFTGLPDSLTQLGAALRFYEVSFRYAPTPQAKGKIERAHQIWQQRLPAIFSAENVAELAPANALLDQLRRHRNAHEVHRELQMAPATAWKAALKENRSVLRPAPNCPWWPYVWSIRTPARVSDEGRVSVAGQSLRVEKPSGTRLVRCQHPDGSWSILQNPPLKNTRPIVLLQHQP
jgi:hypothetical protein